MATATGWVGSDELPQATPLVVPKGMSDSIGRGVIVAGSSDVVTAPPDIETSHQKRVAFNPVVERSESMQVEENKERFSNTRIVKEIKSDGRKNMDDELRLYMICMKKGLDRSIKSISPAGKMRFLDPKVDFTYKAPITFNKPEDKYKFKFTGYSPMCYRHIREFLGVDATEYLSVLSNTEWNPSGAGKSSAHLYFVGKTYVVKSMTHNESKFLRKILHLYYHHIRNNPHTTLPRFLGHYSVVPKGSSDKRTYIIMNNVFDTKNKINEIYDLKGSTVGRLAEPGENIMKDLDIKQLIYIGPVRKQILLNQLNRDSHFLEHCGIMDYSFLLGIHRPGNRNHPSSPPIFTYSDESCLNADDGGMLSEGGGPGYRGIIYYAGVIDILQEYTSFKKSENFFKGIKYDRRAISAVPPPDYASRFREYISKIVI